MFPKPLPAVEGEDVQVAGTKGVENSPLDF